MITYVIVSPAFAVAGPLFAIDTSACSVTLVEAVARLLVPSGSAVVAVTRGHIRDRPGRGRQHFHRVDLAWLRLPKLIDGHVIS